MKHHSTKTRPTLDERRPFKQLRRLSLLGRLRDKACALEGSGTELGLGEAQFARPAESKESEGVEAIERDGAKWQALLQSTALAAANGILITDHQGQIVWANPAFIKLTGYRAEEIMGKNLRILKSGRHSEAFYRDFWDTILSGHTWRGEFTNRRKDGTLCVIEQAVAPVRQSDGRITHFISITEDETERKRLEEDLRRAQKMEAVGQLAAGFAHEFNNVLTVIRCNTELLLTRKEHLTPAESESLLQRMVSASDRAADLTRELVAFSRQQVLQCQPLDLNETVKAAVKVLRRNTNPNIRWQCDYAPDLPSVTADARMIQQVIKNLVSNAIDAMPGGGGLTLRTEEARFDDVNPGSHPEARPGQFVCLSISDNGCGILPENLPRVFDPFFTTKEVGRGTGLGLAVVYGIIKQHQGWIEVTSETGEGATFRVFLPTTQELAVLGTHKSLAA
jgi:two-component system, cell cycle sensor histidine kinase and response regulator CckA